LPHTRDEWVGFALLPFKGYVIAALPLYLVFHGFISARIDGRSSSSHVFMAVYLGYLLCTAVLLLGALIQATICKRGAAMRTLLFVGYCIFLFLIWRR
jgi:hypothetical protein